MQATVGNAPPTLPTVSNSYWTAVAIGFTGTAASVSVTPTGGITTTNVQAALDTKKAAASVTSLTTTVSGKLDTTAYTAADVKTKMLTVEGSGSGLDADVVCGTTPGTFGLARLADANQAAAQTALGLGSAAYVATTTFAASSHTHTQANVQAWLGYWPVDTGRLAFAGDRGIASNYGTMDEPWGGAVVTGACTYDAGAGTTIQELRRRYMQLHSPAGWWTIGYA